MKVLHVIGQLTPGGSEKMTLQVAGGLRARGDDHRIVALGEVDTTWIAGVDAAVPVIPLSIADRDARSSAKALRGLARHLREVRPDIVQGHSWKSSVAAGLLGRALRLRTVATLHRVYYPRLERSADRIVQHAWDAVVVDSEAVRDLLAGSVAIDSGRIAVIPNFVAPEFFAMRAPQPHSGVMRVLMAAHFTPVKGHITLLEALRGLRGMLAAPAIHVDFLGEGPLLEHAKSLVAAWGIEDLVTFHGRRSDLPRWMDAADAVVLPSSWEGFGMILAEGMAAARPVVACDVGGATEVVVDGATGYLTPVGDAHALSAALRRLMDEPATRVRLGAAGRRRARQHYGSGPVLDAYAGLYQRLAPRAQ